MGHEAGGKLHLFPEEALFLMETVSICKLRGCGYCVLNLMIV